MGTELTLDLARAQAKGLIRDIKRLTKEIDDAVNYGALSLAAALREIKRTRKGYLQKLDTEVTKLLTENE